WEKLKPRFSTCYNFAFSQAADHPEVPGKVLNYRLATKGLLLSATTKIKNTIVAGNDRELIDLYTTWQDQKRTLAIYYTFSRQQISEQRINIDSLEAAANRTERQLSERSSEFASSFVNRSADYRRLAAALKAGESLVEMIQYPVYDHSLTT